jgi:hypothetical protein
MLWQLAGYSWRRPQVLVQFHSSTAWVREIQPIDKSDANAGNFNWIRD